MFNVYFFFSKTTTTLFITLNGQCGLPFRSHQSDHHSWTTKRRPRSSFHCEKFLNSKDAKKWFSVCGWKCGNKGAKNYFQFIADYNQLCFTPLFGFEMVRCACWFSYWWYSFLWEASRCPGCSWRPWDKFFRTNKIKDMWIIYAIFYKNNYNCHWRAFCT